MTQTEESVTQEAVDKKVKHLPPRDVPTSPPEVDPGEYGPRTDPTTMVGHDVGADTSRIPDEEPIVKTGIKDSVPKPVAVRPPSPEVVQLDQNTVLEIELLTTKMQLAAADERLAKVALRDAQSRQAGHRIDQERLLAKISEQVGKPIRGNLRLLDKEKGLCRVE